MLPESDYTVVKVKSHFVNHSLHFDDCMSCNTIHDIHSDFLAGFGVALYAFR